MNAAGRVLLLAVAMVSTGASTDAPSWESPNLWRNFDWSKADKSRVARHIGARALRADEPAGEGDFINSRWGYARVAGTRFEARSQRHAYDTRWVRLKLETTDDYSSCGAFKRWADEALGHSLSVDRGIDIPIGEGQRLNVSDETHEWVVGKTRVTERCFQAEGIGQRPQVSTGIVFDDASRTKPLRPLTVIICRSDGNGSDREAVFKIDESNREVLRADNTPLVGSVVSESAISFGVSSLSRGSNVTFAVNRITGTLRVYDGQEQIDVGRCRNAITAATRF